MGKELGLGDREGIHAYFFSLPPTLEFHCAGNPRKQRVISSDIDVQAREKFRSSLANQDTARCDRLPAVGLDAQILGIAVPPVSR